MTFNEEFERIRKQHPGVLLLFRNTHMFQFVKEDVAVVRNVMGMKPRPNTVRSVAEFPIDRMDNVLSRLVKAGHRVAVCDEVMS